MKGWEDFYEYYTKHSVKRFKNKRIWRRQYRKLIAEYYTAISKIIIYDSFRFYLSHRMGTINIFKYDPINGYLDSDGNIRKNRLPVDWSKTLKLWWELYGKRDKTEYKEIKDKPLVFYNNDHSDDFLFKWHWDKRSCLAKHQSKYYFQAVRQNKRRLGKAIKSLNYIDYPLLEK